MHDKEHEQRFSLTVSLISKKILAHKLVTPMSSYVDPLELTRLAEAASAIVLKRVDQIRRLF